MAFRYKRYKKDFPHSYAPGVFPALELLRVRPDAAQEVLLRERALGSPGAEKLRLAAERAGVAVAVDDRLLDSIAPKENCNALAVFGKWEPEPDLTGRHIVLHQPDNMGNLGTVLRTALGFGVRDVVLIRPAVDAWDPRVVRASMGAVFGIRWRYCEDFSAYTAATDVPRFALALAGGAQDLRGVDFPEACALVFGNEGAGLPDEVVAQCRPVRIAHSGEIDSLNLAVAAAIALYELEK